MIPAPESVSARLLAWYDRHARELLWRTGPAERARGIRPDPYRVWLSEVMLQQTTVAAVKDYFAKFTAKWPDVAALAAASEEDILKAWAGLGYYSRARNLKKCADAVVAEHGGNFPGTANALRALPGIGDYTAAAIAAIAFDEPAAVVDGNVERVVARLFAIDTPLPAAKKPIRERTGTLTPQDRPGDFAQAMMDLGATVCTPKRPACITCPLRDGCLALKAGDPERFPVRAPKRARPVRRGAAYVLTNDDGAVLLERRGPDGLLAGMTQVPTTGWNARADGATDTSEAPLPQAHWTDCGAISHVFTHFELRLSVFRAEGELEPDAHQWWSEPDAIAGEALPTVMKKVLVRALQHESGNERG
ncbi:A/G-specific adenine glycosylase [Oricola thermophila]|uniref:Adenine DNA glycosylase n=1 Tax=Oricola thermophila TaxID=2742145 RepID=A0A6N1VD81_9HYPH|nr:A/G-specific adenine glycosylase [Oricola thermophila]QKV18860.1 A/G-specific adenine glycosylase [Oricola thermophila]